MKMVRAIALAVLSSVVLIDHAHAGPIELFKAAALDPSQPDEVIAPYMYGQAGMFISDDAGKDYKLLCSSQISSSVANDQIRVVANGGSIYIGSFDGVYRGDKTGCNFSAVPELVKHFIGDVQVDPLDPKRMYVVTADPSPANNGIFMNDGSPGATFSAYGTQEPLFVNTLDVVKNGTARRYYETGVKNDPMTNAVRYFVRVSDDEGKTWVENEYPIGMYGPMDEYAEFAIMAIDPQNIDHVIARVSRSELADTVLYSPMQGKAGSWVMLAEVGVLDAVTFAPDGALYFGDDDQASPGLFVVDKPGDMPRSLSTKWKVGCLTYDAPHQRMLACNDFRFGTADLTSGAFSLLFDMRCAPSFVECPGAMPAHDVCATQLLAAYCGVSHYPIAPLCDGYDQGQDAAQYRADIGYSCVEGVAVSTPDSTDAGASAAGSGGTGVVGPASAGSGGSSVASSAAQGGAPAAGAAPAAAGASAPAPATKSGGCGVLFARSDAGRSGLACGALGLLALVLFQRRRRRA
jgi:hypothetical protein